MDSAYQDVAQFSHSRKNAQGLGEFSVKFDWLQRKSFMQSGDIFQDAFSAVLCLRYAQPWFLRAPAAICQ